MINKETEDLENNAKQTHITDIYRTFHPKSGEHTLLSNIHKISSRIDNVLSTKQILIYLKRQKSLQVSF
jgi:hypothetical protein